MATPPVVNVCEIKARAGQAEAIELRIDAWSSLPSEHLVPGVAEHLRTYSETMQAVGHKWQIEVVPGGWSKSSHAEAEV